MVDHEVLNLGVLFDQLQAELLFQRDRDRRANFGIGIGVRREYLRPIVEDRVVVAGEAGGINYRQKRMIAEGVRDLRHRDIHHLYPPSIFAQFAIKYAAADRKVFVRWISPSCWRHRELAGRAFYMGLQSHARLDNYKLIDLAIVGSRVRGKLEALFQKRAHHLPHILPRRVAIRTGFDGVPLILCPLWQLLPHPAPQRGTTEIVSEINQVPIRDVPGEQTALRWRSCLIHRIQEIHTLQKKLLAGADGGYFKCQLVGATRDRKSV